MLGEECFELPGCRPCAQPTAPSGNPAKGSSERLLRPHPRIAIVDVFFDQSIAKTKSRGDFVHDTTTLLVFLRISSESVCVDDPRFARSIGGVDGFDAYLNVAFPFADHRPHVVDA